MSKPFTEIPSPQDATITPTILPLHIQQIRTQQYGFLGEEDQYRLLCDDLNTVHHLLNGRAQARHRRRRPITAERRKIAECFNVQQLKALEQGTMVPTENQYRVLSAFIRIRNISTEPAAHVIYSKPASATENGSEVVEPVAGIITENVSEEVGPVASIITKKVSKVADPVAGIINDASLEPLKKLQTLSLLLQDIPEKTHKRYLKPILQIISDSPLQPIFKEWEDATHVSSRDIAKSPAKLCPYLPSVKGVTDPYKDLFEDITNAETLPMKILFLAQLAEEVSLIKALNDHNLIPNPQYASAMR